MTAWPILVIGEALMDIVTNEQGTTRHPGGSPANVAVGLARLGANVSLLTQLGDDNAGEAIRLHLVSEGVNLLSVAGGPSHRTPSATAVLNPDGSAGYVFDIDWALPPQPIYQRYDVIHAGSIASFLAPGSLAVYSMMEQQRGLGLLSYDPNIRPQLLPDHASVLKQFEAMVSIVDIVKLSDEDAAWLYPHRSGAFITDMLHELGARLVIITQGKDGAALSTPTYSCNVPAISVSVADTIGAGDSYMAAVLSEVCTLGRLPATMKELMSMGKVAAHAAGITVSRTGAQPPKRDELLHSIHAPIR